ncbi:MAE_28990/MAE_18760 family HEPN-like nuclease [Paenibacillus sp. MER 180]|uniref:MAE_28990/MAE_18760 family HEPN-like nuclease n=1 Tax=Paenibacillus sp. MER 180 TaxID=2939570 RepID=UPI00203DFA87|nr:MAE_28990/MAE_18760 family HEPN-like nuclease [Paenibacillus sp. MER 180]MCM3289677.1 MAE_28990/MAE_18760 family HEPN-like nuclease [Paenibacillus sp. MER 180]
MFEHVKRESAARFVELRDYLNYITPAKIEVNQVDAATQRGQAPVEPSHKIVERGLFFVHLYGVVEYTVRNTVSTAISTINNEQCKYSDLKPVFLSLALDGEFESLSQVKASKKWEKRWEILSKGFSNEVAVLNNDIIPTDGANIKFKQLESIWKSFCIDDPILPRVGTGGLLNELVTNRNKIAHGVETPETVGRRFTYDELTLRFDAISELCSYIINTFESYIEEKKFKK